MDSEKFPHDRERLPLYEDFGHRYGLTRPHLDTLIRLYDIHELDAFLPPNPSAAEQEALCRLIGAQATSGYLDYARSTNTFELIMQWQEATQHWVGDNPLHT